MTTSSSPQQPKVEVAENVRLAAEALREARASRRPIAPISRTYAIAGVDAAYAVADINTQATIAGGRRVVGRKIGLTSQAVQRQLGVEQPDFGVLFDDMEFLDGQDVPVARLMQPKVEAEIAFVVSRDLAGALPSWGEFVGSIAYVLPALEIVDSAITEWKITLVDTVADNASCGLYVLGDQPMILGTLQLADLGMEMTANGQVASTGGGAACMGHPLRAAYWLARTMVERGQGLRAGELILSGALGPMVTVQSGDRLHATLGALGTVSCRMV